ncbi:MAG: hypothetical protein R3E52_16705 [Burkholderiaceae bacterium]
MNRCSKSPATWRRLALGATLALAGLLPLAAQAQMQRLFPAKVQRGAITFTAPPVVQLDGKTERLGPGVRVRDAHNRVALTGTLRGKSFVVNYQRDAAGMVREIWILTPAEIARSVRGAAADTARPEPEYLN